MKIPLFEENCAEYTLWIKGKEREELDHLVDTLAMWFYHLFDNDQLFELYNKDIVFFQKFQNKIQTVPTYFWDHHTLQRHNSNIFFSSKAHRGELKLHLQLGQFVDLNQTTGEVSTLWKLADVIAYLSS